MIGIVIVSLSKKLAEGVEELANEISQGRVRLAISAGIDDFDNQLNTNAMQVYQAIESVWDEGGVVVLMDLGSALRSVEMALELLSEEKRSKVWLCEAPLVEGTMAAVMAVSADADIKNVLLKARGAMVAKAQLFEQHLRFVGDISTLKNQEVVRGDKILISAVGEDAGEALSALQVLINSNFGEELPLMRPILQETETKTGGKKRYLR